MSNHPNHTIYINNLNEKIKKDGKYLYCMHFIKNTIYVINLTGQPSWKMKDYPRLTIDQTKLYMRGVNWSKSAPMHAI